MKQNHSLWNIAATLLLAGGLLAACTQDEPAEQGTPLPEGRYPLQIGSVTLAAEVDEQPWGADAPQTRVREDYYGNNSMWEGGDQILVGIEGYDPKYSKKYVIRVTSDGQPYVFLSDDSPVYWQSTQAKKVRAWYPVDSKVHLDNQTTSNGLAYALYAETADAVDYTKHIILPFTHKLSKVRVVLEGDKKNDVTDVKIKTYTSCTLNTDGTLTAGDTEDFIPMAAATYNGVKCWEANVVPGHEIAKIMVNGIENTLTKSLTPQAAKVNTITLTVNDKATEVNVSEITGSEYTVSGNIHIKGNGQSKDLKLIMEVGAKLTIEDVKLAPTTDGNAITCQGDATITLKGNNTLTAKYTGEYDGHSGIFIESGTLIINGDNAAKLITTGEGYNGAGIGATNGANITINGGNIVSNQGGIGEASGIGSAGWGLPCGTITINGGIIESWGGDYSAGIGGSYNGACGDIIITGGNIKAYGGSEAPGIGNGLGESCGDITISGASTVVYTKKGPGGKPSSIGSHNSTGSCGTVTIGSECTVTQE